MGSARKAGKNFKTHKFVMDALKQMKVGETIGIAGLDGTRIFRLEEIRTKPNGINKLRMFADEFEDYFNPLDK